MRLGIRKPLVALTLAGALVGGGAAIAHAATSPSPSPSSSSSSSSSTTTHHCPNG